MNKRNKVRKLGKKSVHRKLMQKTQLTMLLEAGKILTTTAKAKSLKSYSERVLHGSLARNNDKVRQARYLKYYLNTDLSIKNILKYTETVGTAVSIVRVSVRPGDNAELSEVYLPDFDKIKKASKAKSSETGKKTEEKIKK
ncbi:MAG TPA: hypothetical protein ENN64_00215 [bacterium]|nr:hypothetical protein [bacterium]